MTHILTKPQVFHLTCGVDIFKHVSQAPISHMICLMAHTSVRVTSGWLKYRLSHRNQTAHCRELLLIQLTDMSKEMAKGDPNFNAGKVTGLNTFLSRVTQIALFMCVFINVLLCIDSPSQWSIKQTNVNGPFWHHFWEYLCFLFLHLI